MSKFVVPNLWLCICMMNSFAHKWSGKGPSPTCKIFHASIFFKVCMIEENEETVFKHIAEFSFVGC